MGHQAGPRTPTLMARWGLLAMRLRLHHCVFLCVWWVGLWLMSAKLSYIPALIVGIHTRNFCVLVNFVSM